MWSLLGIEKLSQLQSNDLPSDVLAKVLYGLFLSMAVVMMMNMMIALLSNTYQQVEDNAFYEWSYRKATTIRTYVNYHPVPVPFNIISLTWMFIRHIYHRLCSKKSSKMRNSKTYSKFFDCLVHDLEADYLAAYGYKFPLTGTTRRKK
ncbi:short transient receptor potential channel 2 homolog [Exaiptasia diaphana]|uniref:Ion transport domain-containing protein n=1 Tax=Exaiptasia diaphana TaxID=2652724 RepID=A0A913XUT3_EXADI|nr:short transient receptor potential channel 2 homolog [Exaiptasia diaphana]